MDPAIARPVEQVKTWLQLWPKLGDKKGLVTKAWASLYTQIQVAGDRWANARSAMSGLICLFWTEVGKLRRLVDGPTRTVPHGRSTQRIIR